MCVCVCVCIRILELWLTKYELWFIIFEVWFLKCELWNTNNEIWILNICLYIILTDVKCRQPWTLKTLMASVQQLSHTHIRSCCCKKRQHKHKTAHAHIPCVLVKPFMTRCQPNTLDIFIRRFVFFFFCSCNITTIPSVALRRAMQTVMASTRCKYFHYIFIHIYFYSLMGFYFSPVLPETLSGKWNWEMSTLSVCCWKFYCNCSKFGWVALLFHIPPSTLRSEKSVYISMRCLKVLFEIHFTS